MNVTGVKMPGKRYNWKRFWCPRTGNIDLSDRGYLYDPDSEYGHIHNPNAVPFESIETVPCLVLLGEPGIGKTRTMYAERDTINNRVEQEDGQTLWLDLHSYGSEDRLVRELFGSPEFDLWRNGTHRLHVFLDSLDECLLEICKLATLLPDEFKKCPVERLCLRIACRTADLPNVLEEGLKELWKKDAVGVYELAPLRRVDVIEAAKTNDLDTDAFLHEIEWMEAVPLVIKPITLEFLMNTYKRTGKLLSTQRELYFKGCRRLCEEINESRRAAKRTGNFTAEERMAVAARIAAIIIFANRYAIWTGVDMGAVPDDDVTVRELCGGSESVSDDKIQVSEDAVRETLATGLFSSRGPKRIGWAHQTYAEFLAARYLVQRGMTLSQVMSLITHPDGKLVPQLHETAAWLACMAPDVFQEIMKIDPEVLLRSDVASTDPTNRKALVESLLILYGEEKSFDHDWAIRGQYQKLAHPELAEQLRPYICDGAKNDVVRRVVINIAEACKLQTLQSNLVDVALDPTQPVLIRVEAACAVGRVGDDTTKAKLKPLVIGEAENDPDDQLKGYGLQAVWPDHITAEELFSVLTPPNVEFYGTYQTFISHELVQRLNPTDLTTALTWIAEQLSRHEISHSFGHLMDNIMLKAWEHIESPDVSEAFAKAVLSRLKHRDEIVGGLIEPQFRSMLGDDEKRRRAVDAIVPVLPDSGTCLVQLVHSNTPLVIEKDILWMIGRLQCEESKDVQRVWAELIEKVFDRQDIDQFDTIFTASQKNPILEKQFAWLLKSVELNSPKAQEMKEHHSKIQEWMDRANDCPILDPPPAERIDLLLDECTSGNLSAWWRLNMELTLEPDSTFYGDELESDLTVLPGWKAADAATKARIVETAKRYVREQDPKTQEWLGTNTIYRPVFAGYRALRLLLQEAPDFNGTTLRK
ncbi:MAG: hypothetical protein C4B59_13450 [Candidatus Methanogaster sp.]|uniref:Uncharacterized protein n=1 Tax=Candidatus Methanogaster sp. TaxID=3386292 RepID=A0AC61KZP1_9EURY|nr:MAG: hypothetical protein C4B59_13450 [ANME-2 cluster archaeon]